MRLPVLARFVGFDLTADRVPDVTTLKNYRHLLEAHQLEPRLLDQINARLVDQGLLLRAGTLVDATLIAAPPSNQSQSKTRDSAVRQTQKGNQWSVSHRCQYCCRADPHGDWHGHADQRCRHGCRVTPWR